MYKLKVSYISYQSLIIEGVEVKSNEITKLNIPLQPSVTQIEDVVVTAEALKSTEASILKIQKNSGNIVDGMSAELITKNNSSDGTDVLKRMTGVTISDGKYAFIRGIGDRYNNTLLNGASLPSTDPEKKSFSYDIFPASLIENVLTAKTFTPDKPADFSGGLVQISTIEFPSKFLFDVSVSATYNTLSAGESFFTSPNGYDFLGFSDKSRNLPSLIDNTLIKKGNFSESDLENITGAFNNNWDVNSATASINSAYKINIGNKYGFGENIFGFIGSLSYSSQNNIKQIEKNFYDFSGSRYDYKGNTYAKSAELGALLNLSFKLGKSNKISFKNIYNKNGDDISTRYKGDYRYALQYRDITSINYIARSLLSNQIVGEHQISLLHGLNFDWNINYSQSKRDEPDSRRFIYARDIFEKSEPLRFQLDQSLATRYYGNLDDKIYGGTTDFTLKIWDDPSLPKIKFGYEYDKKKRSFNARTFGFKNIAGGDFQHEDSVLQGPISQIFTPENINKKFIQVIEITKLSDSYESDQNINSVYAMFDATAFNNLKIIAGARYEQSIQKLKSFDLQNHTIEVNNTYNDVLPSVNLTYLLNDKINIRGAFSTTLARPEFRELAPFSYFNFIDNELAQGNPDLKRTLIGNYDLRFETYPSGGELLAISFFYKKFDAPIEEVLFAAQNEPIRSFANAQTASNYGIELELRKNLNFISSALNNFSFIGNASLIKSKIKIENSGFQQTERALQGQAPYIFNLGLYYDDFENGLNASLAYNKVGERIKTVGSVELGNIIEKPIDLIDVSISKKLFSSFNIKLSVKDLLNQERTFIQKSPLGDKAAEVEKLGRNINLGFNYQL